MEVKSCYRHRGMGVTGDRGQALQSSICRPWWIARDCKTHSHSFLAGVYAMQEITDHFGVHDSTVSRAVHGVEVRYRSDIRDATVWTGGSCVIVGPDPCSILPHLPAHRHAVGQQVQVLAGVSADASAQAQPESASAEAPLAILTRVHQPGTSMPVNPTQSAHFGQHGPRRGRPVAAQHDGHGAPQRAVRVRADAPQRADRCPRGRSAGHPGHGGAATAGRRAPLLQRLHQPLLPHRIRRVLCPVPGHPGPLALVSVAHRRLPDLSGQEGPGHRHGDLPRARLHRLRRSALRQLPRIGPTASSTERPTSTSSAACSSTRASTISSSTRTASTPWCSRTAIAPTRRSPATRRFPISLRARPAYATSITSTTGPWTWRCAPGPLPTAPTTSPHRARTCSPAAAPRRDTRWRRWRSSTSRATIPRPPMGRAMRESAWRRPRRAMRSPEPQAMPAVWPAAPFSP